MNINIAQLKNDRKELEEKIKSLKTELRSPWTKLMGGAQVELLRLKRQVTELHILRAYTRGHVHLKDRPEYCQEIAERVASRYQKEEAAA